MKNRIYSLLVLLLVGSTSLWAQDNDPFGDVNKRKYQGNMTITAQVQQNGNVITDAVVAVYCDNELRGKERVGAGTNPKLAFLTVYGEYTGNNDYLYFKVYTGGKTFTCNPTPAITFTYNGLLGTENEPYIIDITPVSLANDADNSVLLTTYEGQTIDVAFTGRTLFKDGEWNTLCLPFSLSEEQVASSDLAGATIMELDASGTYDTDKQTGFNATNGTLYLYFKTAESIEAGKPYIVKWTSGTDLEKPIFTNVTITSIEAGTVEAKNSGLNTVQFIGTYSPAPLTPNDKSNLFLGEGSTLYYPSAANDANGQYYYVNSCRAYFHVDLNGSANIRAFVLNFSGDDATGIIAIDNEPWTMDNETGAWYDLSGRKFSEKPWQGGIYINNGRKVMIK